MVILKHAHGILCEVVPRLSICMLKCNLSVLIFDEFYIKITVRKDNTTVRQKTESFLNCTLYY